MYKHAIRSTSALLVLSILLVGCSKSEDETIIPAAPSAADQAAAPAAPTEATPAPEAAPAAPTEATPAPEAAPPAPTEAMPAPEAAPAAPTEAMPAPEATPPAPAETTPAPAAPAAPTEAMPAPEAATPSADVTPAPLTEFSQELSTSAQMTTLKTNEAQVIPVTIKNTGKENWAAGAGINLVAVWLDTSGKAVRATRALLPEGLAAGESTTLMPNIKAPAQPGSYTLHMTMVQEKVAFFDKKGATPLDMKVDVIQ